jgi:transposase
LTVCSLSQCLHPIYLILERIAEGVTDRLRGWRIQWIYGSEQWLPWNEVAELFGVSQSTLEKWLHQWRTTGALRLQTDRCGRRRVLAAVEEVVQAEVTAQPDATLDELCERVSAKTGVSASRSVMCRELKRLGLHVVSAPCHLVIQRKYWAMQLMVLEAI